MFRTFDLRSFFVATLPTCLELWIHELLVRTGSPIEEREFHLSHRNYCTQVNWIRIGIGSAADLNELRTLKRKRGVNNDAGDVCKSKTIKYLHTIVDFAIYFCRGNFKYVKKF